MWHCCAALLMQKQIQMETPVVYSTTVNILMNCSTSGCRTAPIQALLSHKTSVTVAVAWHQRECAYDLPNSPTYSMFLKFVLLIVFNAPSCLDGNYLCISEIFHFSSIFIFIVYFIFYFCCFATFYGLPYTIWQAIM